MDDTKLDVLVSALEDTAESENLRSPRLAADAIATLRRELAEAKASLHRLRSAARNLRQWGVEHDDARLGYLTVQVDRMDVDALDAALAALGGDHAE